MSNNSIEVRRKKYFNLSSQIAQLDNTQLHSLFDKSGSNESTGGATNQVIILGQSQVFVKHIPVTNIEYKNLFSTRNFSNLPTNYNYGCGSIGLGVFRELIAHIKTTNWVLEGVIATFPLMYHYRIIPLSGRRINIDLDLQHWGNNANVRNYVLDKAHANYELVLFLEYIPNVLETWLRENLNQLEKPLNELWRTIAFLGEKGIIHFDAHFRNILTDGEQIYLTDFGLVLDKSFVLTEEEESFFERNRFYDYGEVMRNLGHPIRWLYDSCSELEQRRIQEKYGIKEGLPPFELRSILLDNIEQIYDDGDMNLDRFYVATIVKYRKIIALMSDFFFDMCANSEKAPKLPHNELQLLLKETRFIPIQDTGV
ncbi:hypothetical protein NIES2119_28770 [[Phormidium ambiguum] IAM M-71]|uniref:Protein kinase domain-containing protein n=1 Tax=[Phormidium ambiguum] IAM M-71 TaxID=454136 RepID=A0A1U7I5D8_9CYAN|nr:hypothetical protein [Phormidium ambiguum]OKH31468.1 hypothetical protein NIES2119_28770 [Phormidium ambiguum IAM M-71]